MMHNNNLNIDLLQRQAMSDSNRIGLTPDKENSYAVLQKKKQLQNREGSYSSQQKNDQKAAMQKSSSLQHFYRAQSAIEKSSYSNQKKTYVKDNKNLQQSGYKQRHNQAKQIQDDKLEVGIVLTKPNQQYKRLNDKLHHLEKQINHLKESFENNESQLEKKTERTKQYSLASKFFKKKNAESNSKNNSQDEKRVPKDIKQIYNIYSQIREFKNYANNTQLLKKVQEKKKFQLQDFVTQIKGKYQQPDKKLSFASQISSNLNKSERPKNQVEGKQSYCFKMSETQQNENFLYYISTVIDSINRTEPSRIDEIVIDHFSQTLQGLVYATGLELQFDEQKIVNLPRSNNLKTIVFDLDETLVHCNESVSIPGDAILPITFPNGETVQASVNIRPYAQKVLQTLSKHFELIVFTASHSSYANIVIDYLDPRKQWISHRLYREQCIQTPEGAYVKDLRVLGNRKLCNVLLVDNAGYSFGQQIDNGVPIVAYYDNKEDQELLNLQNYLMNFRYVKDVQEYNQKCLKLNQFINFQDSRELLENLFPELYFKGVN